MPLAQQSIEQRVNINRSFNLVNTDPDERFDRISALTQSIFKVAVAAVTFVDEKQTKFKSLQGADLSPLNNHQSLCARAIESGENSFVITDLSQDKRFAGLDLVKQPNNMRFYAGAPFDDIYGNKLGTLCILDKSPRDFSQHEVADLVDLSYLVGEMLKATQTAMYDVLTGLLNRRGFISLAERELSLAARSSQPLTVLVLDLNHFKAVNDQFGHETGDMLLQYFSRQLQASSRKSDLVARLGGDEFVVLLPNAADTSPLFLSRLNQHLAAGVVIKEQVFHVTYSAGAVTAKGSQDRDSNNRQVTLRDLLATADQAMYQQKQLR